MGLESIAWKKILKILNLCPNCILICFNSMCCTFKRLKLLIWIIQEEDKHFYVRKKKNETLIILYFNYFTSFKSHLSSFLRNILIFDTLKINRWRQTAMTFVLLNCTYNYKDLKEGLPITFEEIMPIAYVRRAFDHCLRFMAGYRVGLTGVCLNMQLRSTRVIAVCHHRLILKVSKMSMLRRKELRWLLNDVK